MSVENLANHYKDLFEKTSDLIHFSSVEGRIVLANNSWLTTLGYSIDEVSGQYIFNFIDPDFLEKFKEYRAQIINGIDPGVIQIAYRSKSGNRVTVEGLIGVSLENGSVKYTRGVFRNITEKVIVETRLKSFFESAPDAVMIDQHDTILEWNPKAEKIFGFAFDEVKGKKLAETIIPQQYRDAHYRGMANFLKSGDGPVLNRTIEITALNKNGNEFYINLSIANVLVEREWLFIAFASDITVKKQTEEELIRKEAELLQVKLMEERNDEFITIASHELKTPLTTIKAYTQIALSVSEKQGDQQIKAFLEKVNEYTKKLTNLINELLDVSKIQAGKLKLSTVSTDISQYLKDVLLSIQHITPTHKINLRQNDFALVELDPLRLEQVLTNLISNAAKYSPGKDQILVESVASENAVIISVTDYGIGIPAENLGNIFTRFYRVEETAKDFSGLGIGLFVASEIIKQHNGKIWAESEKGESTTFFIELPRT